MSGITAGELRLTGGPGFGRILDFSMREYPGEHSRAELTGIMEASEGGTSGFSWLAENSPVEIHVDGMERALYSGIIQKAESREENGYCLLRLELCSGSVLLDLKKEKRSFQDVSMTCGQIIRKAAAESGMTVLCPEELDRKPVGFPVIQYRETDWEFLKRLASHFYQPILPGYGGEGIRYSFGLSKDAPKKKLDVYSYSSGNAKEEFLMKKENKVPGIVPDDFGFYKVKSRKYLELGERTEFLARTYFIYESVSVFDGEELMHTYTLRRAGGFQTVYGHNSGIIGASLDATILATKNDTVKVAVAVDGGQKESEAKWFPYSTVYSSPDGTGWYCMPEKGDKVRLYFPNEFEEEGYIISSINLGNTGAQSAPAAGGGASGNSAGSAGAPAGGGGNVPGSAAVASAAAGGPPRSDPDKKTISTKDGKMVSLTPTNIIMTNGKGMMIILDDAEGIIIVSSSTVVITAAENMIIKSDGEIDIQATDEIKLVRGDSKLTLTDELKIEGTKYKMQ